MTHGSLFSGIGGFDLAAEWMGWENKFHCEWNEFGKRVLKYYWPEADSHDDITKTDFTKYNGTVELISGGFPCQPYSAAGKRLGKADDRHLWPHMLRAIKEVAPRWVVGENVRGLTNWNGGLVFDEVCADLENLGYQVAPYLIPACAVNAPHRRERIWFVAYREVNRLTSTVCINGWEECKSNNRSAIWTSSNSNGNIGNASDTESEQSKRMQLEQREFSQPQQREFGGNRGEVGNGTTSDTEQQGLQRFTNPGEIRTTQTHMGAERNQSSIKFDSKDNKSNWDNFPTQPPICGGDDGVSRELDGITFSKWRNESIKAYGNAVVPQVVYQIFKAIEQYETTQHNPATGHR